MSRKNITIATVNIHFGGIRVRSDMWAVLDWFFPAFSIAILKTKKYIEYRLKKDRANPLAGIVESHNPDILIVNEIMQGVTPHIGDYLRKTYKTVVVRAGSDATVSEGTATAIATHFEAEEFAVDIPPQSSGGSCGLFIPVLNTSVIAFHPAALDKQVRWAQIRAVGDSIKKQVEAGRSIIVGGDMNCEKDEIVAADTRYSLLPITNCSVPSFPAGRLMRQLRYPWYWILKAYARAWHGKRAIDQIFIPQDWKVKKCFSVENSSDHEAVLVEARA